MIEESTSTIVTHFICWYCAFIVLSLYHTYIKNSIEKYSKLSNRNTVIGNTMAASVALTAHKHMVHTTCNTVNMLALINGTCLKYMMLSGWRDFGTNNKPNRLANYK